MNPFTEKSDEELQSYFADYEQLLRAVALVQPRSSSF